MALISRMNSKVSQTLQSSQITQFIEVEMYYIGFMARKALEHPVVPIILGALVAWDSPGNIIVRSYALLVLFLWLAWSMWAYLRGIENSRWRQYRAALFCFVCGLTGSVMMGVVYWLLHSKLEELQADVNRNLVVNVQMPAVSDVTDAYFILTNGGKTAINHQDYCGIHLIVGQNKGGVSGMSIVVPSSDRPLGPGESRSVQCLYIFIFNIQRSIDSVACADVEFWTDYTLETDSTKHHKKYFRFIGYEVSNQFVFVPEQPSAGNDSFADDHRYCGKFQIASTSQ